MKFRYFIILFVLFFSSSTILHSQIEPNLYHEADKERMNHWVDSVFSTMTLDQKIGQLFMIVVNPEPREITVSIISRHIREYYVGGISRNTTLAVFCLREANRKIKHSARINTKKSLIFLL